VSAALYIIGRGLDSLNALEFSFLSCDCEILELLGYNYKYIHNFYSINI